MSSTITVALAGLVLGFKHALDADHLAAVATIASERHSRLGAASVGALWGLGHTAALALAGVLILGFGVSFPAWLTWWLEFTVASSLLWLGGSTLWALARGDRVHVHVHQHGGRWHVHPHTHRNDVTNRNSLSHHSAWHVRPFAFGLLHGFAGSAALFLLLLSSQSDTVAAWCYLVAFGASSTAGMTVFSFLISVPLNAAARTLSGWHTRLRALAATTSIVVGIVLGYELLMV